MKKRLLFGAIVALLLCGGAATAAIVSDKEQLSDLTKENIGAMRAFDHIQDNSHCNYKNGYTAFTGRKGGAYDCCATWREMLPKDDKCQ